MRQAIIDTALKLDADVIGFAPASRFDKNDAIFKILPTAKTVIGLGFRVLRGEYRGVEEGTTYYQYTTMGVENLEETVMPLALLRISNLIEENGFEAMPQRRNQLIMNEENETNPEVDYNDIYRGVSAENQIDFNKCAILCGLGEKGLSGAVLNDEYGPFIRYCFIITDAELEPTPMYEPHICDMCGECIKACPGGAIDENGRMDISERFIVDVGDVKYVLFVETLTSRWGMNNDGVSAAAATTFGHFDGTDYAWNGEGDDQSVLAGSLWWNRGEESKE